MEELKKRLEERINTLKQIEIHVNQLTNSLDKGRQEMLLLRGSITELQNQIKEKQVPNTPKVKEVKKVKEAKDVN